MMPSTRPLLVSSARFIPSEYWVWKTTWKPTLEITIQGMTVQKSVANTKPPSPTARTTSASAVNRCWDMR